MVAKSARYNSRSDLFLLRRTWFNVAHDVSRAKYRGKLIPASGRYWQTGHKKARWIIKTDPLEKCLGIRNHNVGAPRGSLMGGRQIRGFGNGVVIVARTGGKLKSR